MVFNSVLWVCDCFDFIGSIYYIRVRECLLFIYVVLKIYGIMRDKFFIEIFYKLGICILYDRLFFIFIEIINSVIGWYEREGVVCLFKFREGLFIIVVVDNIDYNFSLISVYDLFYGIVILLV